MIITDQFVYIHMPKTGGTFVEAALQRLHTSRRRLRIRAFDRQARRGLYIDTSLKRDRRKIGGPDQHQTVAEIPAIYLDRPIAVTVRNPFDHWISYYEFGWWKTHPGDTFDEREIRSRYPRYPDISFGEYLHAAYDWDLLDPDYMPGARARRLDAVGVGPLTYEYIRFLSRNPESELDDPRSFFLSANSLRTTLDFRFLRQERLNRELYEFLRTVGHSSDSVRFILEMSRVYPQGGPRRASRDWESYYTAELRRLVREREAFLFSLFPEYA